MIHVCPLSKVPETIASVRAERLISLLSESTAMSRPPMINAGNHLLLTMHDIAQAQDGMTPPAESHLRRLLDFAARWDRNRPLVINCYAGISRSTASAYIIAAALSPKRDEAELAGTLRRLSPSATPNPLLISIADAMLGRDGRMVAAIKSIGRGADAFEGAPFGLRIDL